MNEFTHSYQQVESTTVAVDRAADVVTVTTTGPIVTPHGVEDLASVEIEHQFTGAQAEALRVELEAAR